MKVGKLGNLDYAPVTTMAPFCWVPNGMGYLQVHLRLSLVEPYASMALSAKHEHYALGLESLMRSATDCFTLQGDTNVTLYHDESVLGTPFFVSLFSLLEVFGGGKLVADYGQAIDKRGVVQIKMTATDLDQGIGEPCAFALKMAKAMAKSYEEAWTQEFFERVHTVLVEHLGASLQIDHVNQFICGQPTGEFLIPGCKTGGWMKFYIDDNLQRFRVCCESEYRAGLEPRISNTHEALKPLAKEWFTKRPK